MGRFNSSLTWFDRIMLVMVMLALSIGIVFARTQIDNDPPATTKDVEVVLVQVEANQDLAACRGEYTAAYFYAFALKALVELEGGYPQDIPIATRNILPPVEELDTLLVEASLNVASLATPETPRGPGILCPIPEDSAELADARDDS